MLQKLIKQPNQEIFKGINKKFLRENTLQLVKRKFKFSAKFIILFRIKI